MRFRPLLFVSFALMGIAGARADVTSTFDTGAEGWTTLRIDTTNGLSPLDAAPFPAANWSAGKLRNDEVSGGLFTLSAPDTYLGDKSAYYQGKVTYDFSDATSDRYPFGNLGFFLVKKDRSVALGYLQNLAPGVETSFSVPLQDDGRWYRYDGTAVPAKATNADLQSVLSNLGYLGINADWTTGTTDVTTLDNVAMAQPVPEPATVAALAAGSLALLRRRRR